jgi:Cdc6-like AAA superfamily ATPase
VTNVVVEVPCDENGKTIDWKSKGWHNRKTKMAHKREKTFIGFYLTLDEAKRALRLHTNEVKYGVCRWHTDNKIKTLCHMIKNQKDGLYTYLNMLSYREILPLETVSDIADKLGYASRPLQVKSA